MESASKCSRVSEGGGEQHKTDQKDRVILFIFAFKQISEIY